VAGVEEPAERAVPRPSIPDDRSAIEPGERVLLIVEDDETFARTLLEHARELGFRGVVALEGGEAMEIAKSLRPDAITLDLGLPDMDGWVLLDRLKHDSETRHIPVHIISGAGEERRGLEQGAVAVLTKPVEREALSEALTGIQDFLARRVKKLLVVEDDDVQRQAILELIGNGDVETTAVATGEEALQALAAETFDCMVLDLKLPGISGTELIRKVKEDPASKRLPIIVYTGAELSREEQVGLDHLAETVIVKDVRSPERLLDETSLFLHRVEADLPERKRKMLRSLAFGDPALKGKKVLVVDDDVRNIFAITSVLEQHEMEVVYAENGRAALEKLAEEDGVDVVLMDIMMPEMDGYEATRRIRQLKQFQGLPVIALTAKAMKGDRDKCIQVGCSDYVTKPVDPDQLVSLLRVWLYR
jgi:CheY-like chemotaxis protein